MTATLSPLADFTSAFDDPLFAKMESGECLWGDLLLDAPPAPAAAPASDPAPEMPEDWDLEFPELRLRKDIWTEFPVTVTPLGAGPDGAERHAITWHRKNFEEWRNTRTMDFDEAMDYFEITLYRLHKCLAASKFWTVEPARSAAEIAVIRMNFAPREGVAEPVAPSVETPANAGAGKAESDSEDDEDAFLTVFGKAKLPAAKAAAPKPAPAAPAKPALLFTRLNDIKEHFPVVWHKVEDAHTRTAVYALEIFGKKLKEMSTAAGKPADAYRADVETRLMAALRTSPAWRVLRSEGREFCRLEMA
jgi:hypothetical protein